MYVNQRNEAIYHIELTHSSPFFHVALAGISHPNPHYVISHSSQRNSLWKFYNFEYVVKGKGYIESNGNKYEVKEGDLFFLSPMREETYYSDKDDPYEKMFLCVSGEFVETMLSLHKVEDGVVIVRANASPIFEEVFSKLQLYVDQRLDSECCTLICTAVLKLVQMLAPPPFEFSETRTGLAAVLEDYIFKNIHNKIRLSDIAAFAHVSVSQVERVFKDEFGISPVRYALDRKLDLSRNLLYVSDSSVQDVANSLAFDSVKYFSRQFQAKFGETPAVFFRRCKKERRLANKRKYKRSSKKTDTTDK